jgi:integrase
MARGWPRWIPPNTRHPKGAWQMVYIGPDGKQHSRMFEVNEKRLGLRWLIEMKAAIDRDEWIDPAAGKVTFRTFAEGWLAEQTFRASTRQQVTYRLTNHLLPAFGDLPIRRIEQPMVQRWVRDLAREGLADSTIASQYTLLGWILAAAVDADAIRRSPCRRVKLPTGRPRRRPMILTPVQAAELVQTIRVEARPMVLVLLATGMRWGEAAGLTRGRVDLLRRELSVVQQRHHRLIGPVKTIAGDRVLPLPGAAVQTLAAALPAGAADEWLVFRSARGGPMARNTFTAWWTMATDAAGLEGLVPHDLRRTYASWLEDDGIPRSTIGLLLGHRLDTDVTSLYITPLPEVRERVIRTLDARLPGPVLPEARSA